MAYERCQIHRLNETGYHALHQGTQKTQLFDSSRRWDACGGPLRTEEEIQLGMCGSCLLKYGRQIAEADG